MYTYYSLLYTKAKIEKQPKCLSTEYVDKQNVVYTYNGIFFSLENKKREFRHRLQLEINACLPGCVWNATPKSRSPLERKLSFWTQA